MNGLTAKPSLLRRFLVYQKERFPLAVHGPLIGAFSFSAIAYSRACRGVPGFIPWTDYAACLFTNLTLFFLLRVADEHKDREDDALYRPYLPVVRGLISLKELRAIAAVLFVLATLLNIIGYPLLLPLYAGMMVFLWLMRYEFFRADWLRDHQVWYMVSHMIIIPLADVYASSYDWRLEGAAAPIGLLFFLGVSYLNGLVLEIGRKMRVPQTEEEGVVSYTKLWGRKKAPLVWGSVLTLNAALAGTAALYAGHGTTSFIVLAALYGLVLLPAILFALHPTAAKAKGIELGSLVWALGMYLILGGIPLLLQLLTRSS